MYRLFSNKKGTDKPIEIFIALFIILAVAMVILKMFSGQIQDKTKELQKIEQREKYLQAKDDAKRECDEICTTMLQNDCNLQQKAQYCQHRLLNGLDIDRDGTASGYSEDLLGGVGVCEDTIYCPHVTTCSCQGDLTMESCVDILYRFYTESMSLPPAQACDLLQKRIQPGMCTIPQDGVFWWDLIDINVIQAKCP